jgi:hypothetical protein
MSSGASSVPAGAAIESTGAPSESGVAAGAAGAGAASESGVAAGGWAAAGPAINVHSSAAADALGALHRGFGRRCHFPGRDGLEVDLVPCAGDANAASARELSAQDEFRERIFELPLERALEWPRPERGIESLVDEQLHGFGRNIEMNLLSTQSLLDLSEQDPNDVAHVIARERMEHDHVVDG